MSYLQYLSVAVDHNENSLHITSYVLKHITDRFCSHRYKNRPEGGCFLTDFAETMSEVFADPDNQPVRRKENYGK